MSTRRFRVALMVVALLLVANPLWLFPHEGDTRYTYERSAIHVENGTITYERSDLTDADAERRNSLNAVGCQAHDEDGDRACAFDHYLAEHSAVTVHHEVERWANPTRPEFVRIGDAYYRRIHNASRAGENLTVTYDVERVTPGTVLAESAVNLSGTSDPPDTPLAARIAITGNAERTYKQLDADDLGTVYRLNGTYYTVVETNNEAIFHDGLEMLRYELFRGLSAVPGVLLLAFLAWSLHQDVFERREET